MPDDPKIELVGVPLIPKSVSKSLEQFRVFEASYFQAWAQEGLFVMKNNQVHLIRQPGTESVQVTFFADPVNSWHPINQVNGIAVSDKDGVENFQLYLVNTETGQVSLLTDGKSRNDEICVSHQRRIAFSSTRRNGQDWDIVAASLDSPFRPITNEKGSWRPLDWSANGDWLLGLNYRTITSSSLYLIEVKTGQIQPAVPDHVIESFGTAKFDAFGKGFYFTSDIVGDFHTLSYRDIATGRVTILTEHISWDIELININKHGKVGFVANEDGKSVLYIVHHTEPPTFEKVCGIQAGLIRRIQFNMEGQRLAFDLDSTFSPGEVYDYNFVTKEITMWTRHNHKGNTQHFVSPSLIRFHSFDELPIPAFVYKPSRRVDKPFAVVVYIHGGPASQYHPTFLASNHPLPFQLLVEQGMAVIAPNVRGSSGYGKNYLALDDQYKREGSVKDIGALLDWIAIQPDLDHKRVAIMGRSYGGYMVLASMIHFGERVRCALSTCGIANFVSFLEQTAEYRRDLRRPEYGDERDPNMRLFLHKISPLTNAHRITKPLLIAHGKNDTRVPVGEALQIAQAVKNNGSSCWQFLAEGEGHVFTRPATKDLHAQVMLLFLQQHLLDQPAVVHRSLL